MSSSTSHRAEPTDAPPPSDEHPSVYENIHSRQRLRESSPRSSPGAVKKLPCARALYSFKGERLDELTFSKGVSIRLLRRVNAEWLEGELDSRIGIFPANYVTIEVGLPSGKADSDLANSGSPYARALHDFPGEQESDLGFFKGDLIELVSWGKGGWLMGKLGEKEGMFPASYVDVIQPLPSPKVSRKFSSLPEPSLSEFSAVSPSASSYQQSNGHVENFSPMPMPRPRRGSGGASTLQSTVEKPTPVPRARSATMRSAAAARPTKSVSASTLTSSHFPLLQSVASSPPTVKGYTVLRLGSFPLESGGSSPDEMAPATVPEVTVSPTQPSGQRPSTTSLFDSVYMNEEPLPVDATLPVPKPRRSSSTGLATSNTTALNGGSSDRSAQTTDYLSSSLDRRKQAAPSISDEVPPPVPPKKRHLLAASGAPHRLPPSPPSPTSPSDEGGSGESAGETAFSFQTTVSCLYRCIQQCE